MLLLHAPAAAIVGVTLALIGATAVALGIKATSALLSYHNNGIDEKDGKITVYSGGFTRSVTVFASKNLIAAENVTTPLRKKAGITSLVIHLKTNAASNEVKVHIQSDTLPEQLEGLLIL